MLRTIRKGETVALPLLEAEPTLADLNYRMAYEDTSTAVNGSPMDLGLEAGRRCGNCARYSDGRCMYARGRPPVDRSGVCDAWLGSTRHPMMGYRRDGAGPKQYDQQSMPDYGEIYGVDALEDAAEQARSDAELRRRAAAARMVHRYGFHGEAPGPVRVQDIEAQANQVEPHRPELRAKAKEPRLVLRTGPMSKGGPYLGPRGGKWADPQHTIPWKEGGDRGAGQSEEPKSSYMSETFYHSSREPLSELRQGKFSVTDDREASEEYLNEEEGHVYEVKVPDDLKLADDDEIKEIARELDPDTPYQRAYEHVDEEPEVMRELQRRGFDGIYIDDETPDNQREHKTITVFDPVKSGLVFREVTEKSGDPMSLQSSINELETLLKAGPRGGKYYRRVPTGNPKRPWRYYYSKDQYDRAHKDRAHVNGAEAKQAREKPKEIKRKWVKGEDFGFSQTDQMHKSGGEYTPERKKLHEKLISKFVDHVPSVPENKKPVAVVTMGGPASGKGTVLRHVLGDHDDLVNVNPDDVKEDIPEYKTMTGKENPRKTKDGSIVTAKDAAFLAHEESSDVSEQVMDRAIDSRKNLILDGTGKNAGKYKGKIERLKKAGYHVRVIMPHVDIGEAHKRMKERANRSGRFVPEDIVDLAHHVIPGNFEDIQSVADEAVLFDNSKPPPRPVWSRKGNEATTHDESYMSEFRSVAQKRHEIARTKGWMKSLNHSLSKAEEKEPDLTLEEMLERIKRSNMGEVEDLSTGLDDFYEETKEALRQGGVKKALAELDDLIKQVDRPAPEQQHRRRRDEGETVEKGFGPNWDSRCLIHGRDLHKASFHEPYATCSCPK